MPAPPHDTITYTTAPADYDWFGTRTVRIAGKDKRGKAIRMVRSDPKYLRSQRERYMSGLHMAVDETEWEKLVSYGLVTTQLLSNPVKMSKAEFNRFLDQVDGMTIGHWKLYWEYPGFLEWSHPSKGYNVAATPDWSDDGFIDLQASTNDGHSWGGPQIPYVKPLTRQQYVRLVRPWLELSPEKWEDAAEKFPRATNVTHTFAWGRVFG